MAFHFGGADFIRNHIFSLLLHLLVCHHHVAIAVQLLFVHSEETHGLDSLIDKVVVVGHGVRHALFQNYGLCLVTVRLTLDRFHFSNYLVQPARYVAALQTVACHLLRKQRLSSLRLPW